MAGPCSAKASSSLTGEAHAPVVGQDDLSTLPHWPVSSSAHPVLPQTGGLTPIMACAKAVPAVPAAWDALPLELRGFLPTSLGSL